MFMGYRVIRLIHVYMPDYMRNDEISLVTVSVSLNVYHFFVLENFELF